MARQGRQPQIGATAQQLRSLNNIKAQLRTIFNTIQPNSHLVGVLGVGIRLPISSPNGLRLTWDKLLNQEVSYLIFRFHIRIL